ELASRAAAESEAVDRDRGAAERDRAADVDGEHATGGAVPRRRRQRRAEGRGRVLRHADDLERPLALRRRGGEGLRRVAVEEAAVLSAAGEVERAARGADGVRGD